jgi:hypothetical protein
VETDLQKLISEYRAIEKMDRILLSADIADETELIGLRVREMRRWEILLELTTWNQRRRRAVETGGSDSGLSIRSRH